VTIRKKARRAKEGSMAGSLLRGIARRCRPVVARPSGEAVRKYSVIASESIRLETMKQPVGEASKIAGFQLAVVVGGLGVAVSIKKGVSKVSKKLEPLADRVKKVLNRTDLFGSSFV